MQNPGPTSVEVQWRIALALGIQLVILFDLPRAAVWRGFEREAGQYFLVGSGAGVCLVLLAPMLFRGHGTLRFWSGLLTIFPLVVLGAVFFEITGFLKRL